MDNDDPTEETDLVYLQLCHGRVIRDQDMDETGFDGPLLGPFVSIQLEYAYSIRGMINDSEDFWLSFDEDPHGLCIYYDGKWYGRVCILPARKLTKDNYYRNIPPSIPDQSKTYHPKKKE